MRGGSERCEQAAAPERWERAPPIHAASSRPPACTPRALAQLACPAHGCGGVMHGEVLPVLPWIRPGKRSRRLLHAAHREESVSRSRHERPRAPRRRALLCHILRVRATTRDTAVASPAQSEVEWVLDSGFTYISFIYRCERTEKSEKHPSCVVAERACAAERAPRCIFRCIQ